MDCPSFASVPDWSSGCIRWFWGLSNRRLGLSKCSTSISDAAHGPAVKEIVAQRAIILGWAGPERAQSRGSGLRCAYEQTVSTPAIARILGADLREEHAWPPASGVQRRLTNEMPHVRTDVNGRLRAAGISRLSPRGQRKTARIKGAERALGVRVSDGRKVQGGGSGSRMAPRTVSAARTHVLDAVACAQLAHQRLSALGYRSKAERCN